VQPLRAGAWRVLACSGYDRVEVTPICTARMAAPQPTPAARRTGQPGRCRARLFRCAPGTPAVEEYCRRTISSVRNIHVLKHPSTLRKPGTAQSQGNPGSPGRAAAPETGRCGEPGTTPQPDRARRDLQRAARNNRVVMRHTIAVNLDSFRSALDDFEPRPARTFAPLQEQLRPSRLRRSCPISDGVRHLPTVLDALHRQTFRESGSSSSTMPTATARSLW
jgi:hypothetical protein